MNPQSNGILPAPPPVSQWMHCQTMPQNYVEFLAEKGCPEVPKQMSYDISAEVPNLRLENPSKSESYLKPHNEGTGAGLEHQTGIQDLCGSRLVGESTCDSVIFPEEQMLNNPLKEMMWRLIDVYPSAANDLLQSRGLVVMPMTFAEGLLEGMLDVQEEGAFVMSK